MNPHVCKSFSWLVCRFGWSVCHNFLKGQEVTFQYFYRSTLLFIYLSINLFIFLYPSTYYVYHLSIYLSYCHVIKKSESPLHIIYPTMYQSAGTQPWATT